MSLEKLREEAQRTTSHYTRTISVCEGSGCLSSKSNKLRKALETEIGRHPGHQDNCRVKGVGCHGLCANGPLVTIEPDGLLYEEVTDQDAADIVSQIGQAPVSRLLADTGTPFFKKQVKVVLENAGHIDPESIHDYILADGYQAYTTLLTQHQPGEVIEMITRSGLRGRGGAGFPTGIKWGTVAKAEASGDGRKFVICNGDEGDPGAFMDRSVMEADPHRVLEGMAIAAYAVGAGMGYFYIRAEYPMAIRRVQKAIDQAREAGLIGDNILGTGFSFDAKIRLGAGAFVCGEETALIASIEGRRGSPVPRPPYPATHGLWGQPTLINNVETLANIPTIIRKGPDWFASIGTEKSKGTKVFALTGDIVNSGLIEVPMGTTLREVVFDIGGGIPGGKAFKAIQTGGPSGGVIPEEYLDTPISYEHLQELGSIMGSGGMLIMNQDTCMVDVAKFYLKFCVDESCGKCSPCRVGGYQLHQIIERITKGRAQHEDLDQVRRISRAMQQASLCGLGQTAPNPVLSSLRYFESEYRAYINGGPSYARQKAKELAALPT